MKRINEINFKPESVAIKITNACNLNCRHCLAKNHKQSKELTTIELIRTIRKLKEWLGDFQLIFSGGEPLIRGDIIKILKYCKKLSLTPLIITNGIAINENMAKKIVKNNLGKIKISIDGMKNIHDYIRGKGVFKRVMESIKLLRKYNKNFPIGINVTITNQNVNEIVNITKWAKKNNFDICFQGLWEKSELQIKNMQKIINVINKLIKMKWHDYPIVNPIHYFSIIKCYYTNNLNITGKCRIDNLKILSDGTMKLCYSLPDNLGNVLIQSPKDAWNKKSGIIIKKMKTCERKCYILLCHYTPPYEIHLPCNSDTTKDFFEILKYVKMYGYYKITLNTNGRMFYYKDFASKVAKLGITQFNVYLCRHNAKIHDSITRVPGSFEQTIEGIKNLKDLKQNVRLIAVVDGKKFEIFSLS